VSIGYWKRIHRGLRPTTEKQGNTASDSVVCLFFSVSGNAFPLLVESGEGVARFFLAVPVLPYDIFLAIRDGRAVVLCIRLFLC